ncbi:hypothetical protein KMW28_17200 [Flammeovirga yaeyamensis]|uniref:Alpha-galactosidase n=1 Tax=Flammeovirga yaeyamensis TaxID=367791 RepID=A0AAX1N2B1_9BACT|nr:hypothetical protein [Flammeovirga yaeyamensis]MBB3698244.1 hypothetical protein [Flammeovirga yaeyamensis]NMF34401.1 hypothetical protein [Flammeovirga yaeyamensis]QWG01382.1 hypothetical protein KMW28_17200 [Flammeovirga yaeyamensis]
MKLLTKVFLSGIITTTFLSCQEEKQHQYFAKIEADKYISKNFIGNGIQWAAYPHADGPNSEWGDLITPAKWDTIYERLDYMQPQTMRVLDQANWRYYKGRDQKGQPIFDIDNPEMKTLYKVLDYCQTRNVDVVFGEWGTPFHVHDLHIKNAKENRFENAYDPQWISLIGQYVEHLIVEKGYTCIKFYNHINEPNGDWASTNGDYEEWKKGVIDLQKEFEKRGLDKYLSITGPGTVPQYTKKGFDYTGEEWVTKTIADIDTIVGAYEIHTYLGTDNTRNGKAAESMHMLMDMPEVNKTGKRFFVGEIGIKDEWDSKYQELNVEAAKKDGYASIYDSQMAVYTYQYGVDMADAVIQLMNAGAQGMIAWDLDDAMHTKDDLGKVDQLKRWGCWNILGTELIDRPEDENIRPWFYPWSWLCKYFPKGTDIHTMDTQLPEGIRMTAGKINDDYSILMVNNSDTLQNIAVSAPIQKSVKLKQLQYTADDYKLNTEMGRPALNNTDLDLRKGGVVPLPARSVTILSSL